MSLGLSQSGDRKKNEKFQVRHLKLCKLVNFYYVYSGKTLEGEALPFCLNSIQGGETVLAHFLRKYTLQYYMTRRFIFLAIYLIYVFLLPFLNLERNVLQFSPKYTQTGIFHISYYFIILWVRFGIVG